MINLKEDYKDYLALLSLLAFGLAAFIGFGYNRDFQKIIIIIIASFYVLWGAVHHSLNKDFHFRILLEYIVIAVFAVALVLTLLERV